MFSKTSLLLTEIKTNLYNRTECKRSWVFRYNQRFKSICTIEALSYIFDKDCLLNRASAEIKQSG